MELRKNYLRKLNTGLITLLARIISFRCLTYVKINVNCKTTGFATSPIDHISKYILKEINILRKYTQRNRNQALRSAIKISCRKNMLLSNTDGVYKFAGSGGGSGDGEIDPDSLLETFYTPIYVLTAVFGAIFVFGPIFARKAKNRDVVITSIMIGAFSMWLFWVTVYIAQMNPLMGPRLSNTTLAWMAYAWGNPAKGDDEY